MTEDHETLLNVRSHVGNCALHWHKLAVEVSGLVVGGAVALAGFAVTRDNMGLTTSLSLGFIAAAAGIAGYVLIKHIEKEFYMHTGILQKVDDLNGLFDPNRFGLTNGNILYPEPWKTSGSVTYKEPLLTYAKRAVLLGPITMGALVAIVSILR
ncbi:hypothetical protein [Luteimonas terrae]|uniref:Uncharacterized protein n=1 Tax=Luteimonas terrae TaxID=1530191 RepID=A0ABU1XV69_9GAMM|nr:hypothetical protein [Luteimonas terrae]MDR7192660.1 hypothetical protein [Luteimonas terrae]